MSLNFCPKCGFKLDTNSTKCEECGLDLISRIEIAKQSSSQDFLIDIYADFLQRSLAWFIDIMIILIIIIPLSIYVNFGLFYVYTNIYLFTIGFFYFWLLETLNKGQTLGRLVVKIRAVDEKTLKPAKLTSYFINNVTKATPFLVFDLLMGIIVNINSTGIVKKRLRIVQNITEIAIIKVIKEKKSSK
ncbi:MAG: RDD family protein [Promethearchaeota archaeon]